MENDFTQLRFDISENVRLQPQQPGIATLLELDLYPDIEIRDEGQHLKIQGYLRLNGVYLKEKDEPDLHNDDFEEDQQELAYVIPVEITLPRDRAEEERISAEVETFDYQVLSPFELKIDAILMIDGLLQENKEAKTDEAEREDTDTMPVFMGQSAQPIAFTQQEDPLPDDPKVEIELETPDEPLIDQEATEEAEAIPLIQPVDSLKAQTEEQHTMAASPQDFWRERQASKQAQTAESLKETEMVAEAEEISNGKEETVMEVDTEADEESVEHEIEKPESSSWISWLLRGKEETFSSLKMVVVQREETIDTLANKYEVSANELIRLNQLQTDLLTEGQVLSLPQRSASNQKNQQPVISLYNWSGKKE